MVGWFVLRINFVGMILAPLGISLGIMQVLLSTCMMRFFSSDVTALINHLRSSRLHIRTALKDRGYGRYFSMGDPFGIHIFGDYESLIVNDEVL